MDKKRPVIARNVSDIKGVIRSRTSKKDTKYNARKYKRTKYDQEITTQIEQREPD